MASVPVMLIDARALTILERDAFGQLASGEDFNEYLEVTALWGFVVGVGSEKEGILVVLLTECELN